MEVEGKTKRYRKRFKQLKQEANRDWLTHWKELSEYMLPRKGRYLTANDIDEDNKGDKRNSKILNSAVLDSIRTLAAGMQGGLTSPSRPWFRLAVPDDEMMEYQPIKEWLHEVCRRMLNVLQRSNFYSSIHGVYEELGIFGTSAMMIEEDFKTIVRFRPYTIGEYYLAAGSDYRPNTIYRRFSFTARQIVERFGLNTETGKIDWSNISEQVKNAYDENNGERRFAIIHCVQPNGNYDPASLGKNGMPYESVYYEENQNDNPDKFLRRSGYNSIPFVAPRWDTIGTDVYGRSPGMDALGDAKMLQEMEKKRLIAVNKVIDPPMNAPANLLKSGNPNALPGGVTYIDVQQGQQGFTPAYQINPDLNAANNIIDQVVVRMRRCFFNDMFMTILGQDKQMTAREVAERHEEKLMMLGPVLERLQAELLDVIITRVFLIMDSLGKFPDRPRELEGQDIKIEYISVLAQAQRMVGTTTIEQLAGFVGNLAGVNPEVIDKLNFDEIVDQYGDMLGAPPKVVRSDDDVAAMRQARAKAQQEQAMNEQMLQSAQGAKLLSEADMGGNSALDALLGGAGAA